ncbi:MAG: pantetheine-phosphate adenylyltransferase [Anaerolineaceae bacterium]
MSKVLFPGTFDPIHYGHIDIARRASLLFDEVVVAVYDKPIKSLLFSPEERIALVQEALRDMPKLSVVGYRGLTINFAREIGAQAIVRGLRVFSDFEYEFRMALANKRLDPDIDVIALITTEQNTFLSSSTVKEIAALGGDVSSMVPEHVRLALEGRFRSLGENQSVVPENSMKD